MTGIAPGFGHVPAMPGGAGPASSPGAVRALGGHPGVPGGEQGWVVLTGSCCLLPVYPGSPRLTLGELGASKSQWELG